MQGVEHHKQGERTWDILVRHFCVLNASNIYLILLFLVHHCKWGRWNASFKWIVLCQLLFEKKMVLGP